MSVSGLGRLTAKAAGAVGDVIGGDVYPETEYGLAAFLFARIVQAERDDGGQDRDYHLRLMQSCLAIVRGASREPSEPR